jgi:biofilm protein TabA
MIYDVLDNAHFYFPPAGRLAKAIDYIKNFDLSQPDGRYEIDGKNMYAIVMSYQTKPAEQQKAETHIKYLDVQAVLSGRERMDVVLLSGSAVVDTPYDETKDAAFYKMPPDYARMVMTNGIFAVLYPQDIHRPCCSLNDSPTSVRKIVVKITLL